MSAKNRVTNERDVDCIGHRVERPWGSWTLLEVGTGYKVKRIDVLPGKRLSLQKHCFRSEHWVVVHGTARVTNDDKVFILRKNKSTFIPLGAVHRLENLDSCPLVVIEVQSGNDLRESDIVRLDDDFGRIVRADSQESRAESSNPQSEIRNSKSTSLDFGPRTSDVGR